MNERRLCSFSFASNETITRSGARTLVCLLCQELAWPMLISATLQYVLVVDFVMSRKKGHCPDSPILWSKDEIKEFQSSVLACMSLISITL
jgi:hypothetical protein